MPVIFHLIWMGAAAVVVLLLMFASNKRSATADRDAETKVRANARIHEWNRKHDKRWKDGRK